MSDNLKPEVNLEISSGYFRIPTEELVYNITVVGGDGSSGVQIVEKIVEVEKSSSASSGRVVEEIERLVEDYNGIMDSLSVSEQTGVGQDTAAVRAIFEEIEKEAQDVREILAAVAGQEQGEADSMGEPEEVALLKDLIQQLQGDSTQKSPSPAEESAAPEPRKKVEKKTLYQFDLDVIFQTLYELCTNETVKSHITGAREKQNEIFNKENFLELINGKIEGLEPDSDNFFNVPLTDVLTSMLEACSEKPIQNLLKKMDAGQASIFLDTNLPLEVPPAEEIEVETESEDEAESIEPAADEKQTAGAAAGGNEIVEECMALIDALAAKVGSGGGAGGEDLNSALQKIDALLLRIPEAVAAFEDAAGSSGMGRNMISQLENFRQQLAAVLE